MLRRTAVWLVCAAMLAWCSGCKVHVDKDANGQEKKVQIDTPFGGIHVNTDQTTASDLGLPVYPGAVEVRGDDQHKSADVRMGFGQWQLRVRAVSYSSHDPEDKVVAFYKKALTRYGDVITCKDNEPVGTPAMTPEGLTCADDHRHSNVDVGGGVQLKAGSKRRQHIVGFEKPRNGETRFSLVALDLPITPDVGQESN